MPAGAESSSAGRSAGRALLGERRGLCKRVASPKCAGRSLLMVTRTPEVEILGPEDAAEQEARIRARFWPTVKKALRYIPFIEEVVAAYYAMLDPRTPLRPRLTLIAALAYFVSPFDLVPDL